MATFYNIKVGLLYCLLAQRDRSIKKSMIMFLAADNCAHVVPEVSVFVTRLITLVLASDEFTLACIS